MNADALSMMYNLSHQVLKLNTVGLTHDDSLLQPTPGGNCLNWVLGHLLASRNSILKLVGEEPIWSEEQAAPYERGSPPILPGGPARPFEEILSDFDLSQERLQARLNRISPEELAAPSRDSTVGGMLSFLQFHESYHVGQTGLLRRLAGKDGTIR